MSTERFTVLPVRSGLLSTHVLLPRNCQLSHRCSSSFYPVHLWWPGRALVTVADTHIFSFRLRLEMKSNFTADFVLDSIDLGQKLK